MDDEVLQNRADTLLKLNMAFYKLFKLVNQKFRLAQDTNHGKHYSLRERVFPTLRYRLIKEELSEIE